MSSGFVGLAVSLLLCGADDAKQTVDAKGLTFEAPASWKSSPPIELDAPGGIEGRADRRR